MAGRRHRGAGALAAVLLGVLAAALMAPSATAQSATCFNIDELHKQMVGPRTFCVTPLRSAHCQVPVPRCAALLPCPAVCGILQCARCLPSAPLYSARLPPLISLAAVRRVIFNTLTCVEVMACQVHERGPCTLAYIRTAPLIAKCLVSAA